MAVDQAEPESLVGRVVARWVSLALAALCLAGAGLSGLAAFAASARGQQAAMALPTGWASGEQHAIVARLMFSASPKQPPAREILEIGREGLRHSPLSAESLAMVGIAQQRLGDRSAAAESMQASLRLTRRDMMTHFWFAETYAQQRRIGPALSHIAMALTTSYNAPSIMLPLLGQAIRDPSIEDGVAQMLRARPAWLLSGVDFLTAMSPYPVNLARIMMKAGNLPDGQAFRLVENRLLDRLVAAGEVDVARSYFVTLKNSDTRDLHEPNFSNRTISGFRGPFAWRGTEDAVVSGSFVRRGSLWELQGSSAPGEGGAIAERLTFLPSGRYRVTASVQIDGNSDTSISGVAECIDAAGGSLPVRFELTRGAAEMVVPPGCTPQRMTIVLVSGVGALGAQAAVSDLRIEPIGVTATPAT